jgi:DNA-binding HxlR family transcriptional regulator
MAAARRRLGSHECEARDVLELLGNKWSMQVISVLSDGTKRFTDLKRSVAGISQRMLTVTLRALERDGIVARTVYPVVPPRVEYALTDLGMTLIDAVATFVSWAADHLDEINAARARYDARVENADAG